LFLNLRKLNGGECKEQYCFGVSDKFAAFEGLDEGVEINNAWEMIREN
jgi:hypothetical protein